MPVLVNFQDKNYSITIGLIYQVLAIVEFAVNSQVYITIKISLSNYNKYKRAQ